MMTFFANSDSEDYSIESSNFILQASLYTDVTTAWNAAADQVERHPMTSDHDSEDCQSPDESLQANLALFLERDNTEASSTHPLALVPQDVVQTLPNCSIIMSGLFDTGKKSSIDIVGSLDMHSTSKKQRLYSEKVENWHKRLDAVRAIVFPADTNDANAPKPFPSLPVHTTPIAETHEQHLVRTDDYKYLVTELVCHNRYGTAPQLRPCMLVDDTGYVKRQFKPFYKSALRQHSQEYVSLKKQLGEEKAKKNKDYVEIAALENLELRYNRDILDDFRDEYLEAVRQPMREEEWEIYDEISGLYMLFLANKLTAETTSHSTPVLVNVIEEQQVLLTEQVTLRLKEVDMLIRGFETVHTDFTEIWKKSYARYHRLVAADIADPAARKEAIVRRQKHKEMPNFIVRLEMDVGSCSEKIDSLGMLMDEIEREIKLVNGPLLDVLGATQSAIFAAIVEEAKIEEAAEAEAAAAAAKTCQVKRGRRRSWV